MRGGWVDLEKRIKIISVAALVLILIVCVKIFFSGKFDSVASLQTYFQQFGIFAPLALTIFQAFQVVVPVLPGYLGCAAGAMAFGSGVGFFCNYLGICAGSIIAYYLARKFGMKVVLAVFSEKFYSRWAHKIEKSKSYGVFLFVATLLPLFPDDFLCYFSGLIRMSGKKFLWIILLGKPWCILAYSLLFGMIK